MSQPETAQVAAALTASMLGEFVEQHGDENAARMLAEMQPEAQPVVAPQTPVVSNVSPAADAAPATPEAAEAAPEPASAEPEVFDFTPKLDDDYRALLEEPDFDEEAAAEIDAEREDAEYDPTFDPQAAVSDRAKDKRIAYLEQQLVKSNKGKWVSEAERSFPLLATYAADELRQVDATSRRGFARAAAALNDRYSKVLGPALKEVAELKALAKAEGLTEARQQAKEQWGLPVAEGSGVPAAVDENQRKLAEARSQGKSLEDRIKILAGLDG